MILTQKMFLENAASVSHQGGIQHVEHPSDRVFDGKPAAAHAIKTLEGAAKGSTPITRKIDDRMSVQVHRDAKGRVGVKYKGPGAHYNYSEEDIDKQHGHKPYVAAPLKAILNHVGKVLPHREGEYQGGFLSTPEHRTLSKGRIRHQPNTIEYSVSEDSQEGQKLKKSKVSMVIHSELKGSHREAHPILDTSEFHQHPDVHLMSHVVGHEEQHNIDPVAKRQVLSHLDKAKKLMATHDFKHLGGHEDKLRSYINSTVSSGATPSVEGYRRHLINHHQKKIDAVKRQSTKDEKAAQRDADLAHVDQNKKAFIKTLNLHGHVQAATNLLSRALAKSAHGGYGHAIEGKETGPEGFVSNGLKIVDRGEGGFSQANRARSAILKASPKLAKMVS
jgi:hypothetical protein